jgi:cell volume regulation protein A
MVHDALLMRVVGALLAAGVAAASLATRLRLPGLVLFAGLGMLVGTDGLGSTSPPTSGHGTTAPVSALR